MVKWSCRGLAKCSYNSKFDLSNHAIEDHNIRKYLQRFFASYDTIRFISSTKMLRYLKFFRHIQNNAKSVLSNGKKQRSNRKVRIYSEVTKIE